MINIQQMMNNPQVRAMMNSGDPRQYAINMMKQSPNANSEMGRNLINMLENNDMAGIESYGKNILESQGMSQDGFLKMFVK